MEYCSESLATAQVFWSSYGCWAVAAGYSPMETTAHGGSFAQVDRDGREAGFSPLTSSRSLYLYQCGSCLDRREHQRYRTKHANCAPFSAVSTGFATVHGNNTLTINAVEAYPLDKFTAEVSPEYLLLFN